MSPVSIDQLLELLADPRSVPDLRTYFGIGTPPGSPIFSGRRFESLGLKDHREDDNSNRFTAADLLAVQCLSVTVPIEIAIDLLEGELGQQISDRLSRIPPDVDLGTAESRSLVQDEADADQAWHLLTAQDDVGFVTAGKLLARKRPRLIPVWDHVVRCALGRPDNAWVWLDDRLRERDAVLRSQLQRLHDEAELAETVSLLRTLDVVVWMRHRDSHRPARCQGLGLQRR